MASLMYGAGLRLLECTELRVKDLNFDRGELTIRDGKCGKDRVTMLPVALNVPLRDHLARVKVQHDADLAAGRGASPYQVHFAPSIPMPTASGPGNGSFQPRASTSMAGRANADAITYMKRSCSVPSRMRFEQPASRGRRRPIPCVIHLQRISLSPVTISAPSRNSSGIET
jgi:hypothetical protein